MTRTARRTGVAALATLTLIGIAACSPPPKTSDSTSNGGIKASAATSAKDLGGMSGLIAAAKKEGTLNVIALPPDWANYGEIIKGFEAKYSLKVDSAQPDASSADEITAAKNLKGQSKAPDVFDLGGAVASANTDMFAAYKVATFGDVPAALKDANGLWVNDYGGYMSIGYDAGKVPAPTTVADLLKPAYRGKVALNGDPTKAGAAFSGVVMAAISQGGTADDISKGVDFFKSLNAAGNFLPVDPTGATIESGQTPVVFDWDYLNVAQGAKLVGKMEWKTFVPSGAVVGGYYVQAINKDAPHPAAARLWQEYLYSDEGQNLWLKGGARPVREEAMVAASTIDKAAYDALPKAEGTPVFLTTAQSDKAKAYLTANWAKAIG
ncbi:MAG: solute-binding protein [Phycicoccus sp.]|nr:solute-binding protein [Phycicoccus sp.]NMM33056.1 solute-binding protein [Phycicoccus sp.]